MSFFPLFILPFIMCFSPLPPGGLVMWPVLILFLKQDNISLCVCLSYSHNTVVWDLPRELPAVHAGIRARVPQPLPGLYPLKHRKTTFFAPLLITRPCCFFYARILSLPQGTHWNFDCKILSIIHYFKYKCKLSINVI